MKALCCFVAALSLAGLANQTPGPAYTSTAITSVSPAYQTYTVADPDAFKKLWLPYPLHSIVFWGGLMIQPNVDYQTYGSVFQVNKDPLAAGDKITVVTFAP